MSASTLEIPVTNGRVNRRAMATACYFASFVALGLTTGALGPTLPVLASHTGSTLGAASSLFTARSLGYVLGSLYGGRLFDRRSGNAVMALTLLVMSSLMALAPTAKVLWFLFAVMLVLGAAESVLDVGANTLLVWVHDRRLGMAMNALHSFFGIGALVSPVIVAVVVATGRSSLITYQIIGLAILPVSGWMISVPSPAPVAHAKNEPDPGRSRGLIFLIATFLFLYVGAEVSFGGWIYSYAMALKLTTETHAAYLTSGFWGALTLGRLLGIPIVAKARYGVVLLADVACCVLSVGLILLIPNSFAVVIAGTIGVGLSMASIFPTLLSYSGTRLKSTGHATGRFVMGASLGAMTLPLLIGQVFESRGPLVVMYFVMGSMLLAGIVLFSILRSHRRSVFTPHG